MSERHQAHTALITGASDGLGRALARGLAVQGWHVIITARGAERLNHLRDELAATAIPGDVSDPVHRQALADTIGQRRRLDLVVNNASELGPSPMPRLAECAVGPILLHGAAVWSGVAGIFRES